MVSRMKTEDDDIHKTDLAAFLGNSGEDPELDDALAEALTVGRGSYGRVATIGKGNGKSKGKIKGKGKGKYKGNNLSLEERKKRLAELKSRTNCQAPGVRGHWAGDDICPKNVKNDSTLQSLARAYLTFGGEISGFDLALTGDEMSFDATAVVARARLDASDIPVETPPRAPPRYATTEETATCNPFTASTDTSVRWRVQRIQSSRYERNG